MGGGPCGGVAYLARSSRAILANGAEAGTAMARKALQEKLSRSDARPSGTMTGLLVAQLGMARVEDAVGEGSLRMAKARSR